VWRVLATARARQRSTVIGGGPCSLGELGGGEVPINLKETTRGAGLTVKGALQLTSMSGRRSPTAGEWIKRC
jgi:hypothetical protein